MDKDETNVHYNGVRMETRAQRARGPLYQLKLVHNNWKRVLLQRYAFGAGLLLDLGCGRGGDTQKWVDCHIRQVHGVDTNSTLIREAIRRSVRSRGKTTCTFQVHDCRLPYHPMMTYDVVTTFFCVHYFCETEEICRTFVQSVSSALRSQGFWMGICLDSGKVTSWIRNGMTSPHLSIQNVSVDMTGDVGFGQAYRYTLEDTVTQSTNRSEGSLEYLVPMEKLITLARDMDLDLLSLTPCEIPAGEYPGVLASEMCMEFVFVKK